MRTAKRRLAGHCSTGPTGVAGAPHRVTVWWRTSGERVELALTPEAEALAGDAHRSAGGQALFHGGAARLVRAACPTAAP